MIGARTRRLAMELGILDKVEAAARAHARQTAIAFPMFPMSHVAAFTDAELAWFRRPLGGGQ